MVFCWLKEGYKSGGNCQNDLILNPPPHLSIDNLRNSDEDDCFNNVYDHLVSTFFYHKLDDANS
jgi:hypothetical protein